MQCKPSLRWDSHKVYSDVSEGWKRCDPYPPPLDINCSIFCEYGPMFYSIYFKYIVSYVFFVLIKVDFNVLHFIS